MAEPGTQPAVDPLVGKVFGGRFKLLELVARGGMGKIYKAEQQPLGRVVALKVLDISDDGDGEFRRRFFNEAKHCAKLAHPNTVRIFDYGETDDGVYYMTMEWLDGHTLQRAIKLDAPVDPLRAVLIMKQICGALSEAHEAGVIHRDLKPANVLVTRHGDEPEFCKVVDFGLVKEMGVESDLSKTGHVLGSPMYMSPEQVNAGDVDGRTDIYACGMILYALLTGKTAFKRGNTLAVLMAQLHQEPPPFEEIAPGQNIPSCLEWISLTALKKEPGDRFATMRELLTALKGAEKEIRGEWVGPVEMSLNPDGLVILPDGLVVSEEIRIPPGLLEKKELDDDEAPSSTTMVTPTMRTGAAVVGLGAAGFAAIAAAVLVMLVALAGGAYVFWPSAEVAPEPVPEPAPVEVATPEPSAPATRKVRLVSEPPGADVERDGVFINATPVTLEIPEGEEWTVTVKLWGYQSRKVRVAADQTEVNVPLRLMRGKPGPAPAPAPAAAPAAAPAPKKPNSDLRNPWGD